MNEGNYMWVRLDPQRKTKLVRHVKRIREQTLERPTANSEASRLLAEAIDTLTLGDTSGSSKKTKSH